MKKILLCSILFICTTVNASKIYLFKTSNYMTNDDNYNYKDYALDKNQILIVPPENGILSNDNIISTDYKIVVLENSKNSHLSDLEYNETTGSFTYTPSDDVVGTVCFKYYIEYDGNTSNTSYIYFYVNNNNSSYTINYYNEDEKIIPSITKDTVISKEVTESAKKIDGYKVISDEVITKKISANSKYNNFDFYYEKIPYTGI